MATDFQVKREKFSSLAFQIRVDNMDFFRGKTLSKVFIIGKSRDDNPALLFPKGIPDDIQDKLNDAFKEVFG
ncbi:hypothetical protein AAEO56_05415 [Flavobacterium sp. DGU11]|uniref:Uncharacterized protein n=1 Tax=Flavobacterium arundinis TaxID=3139143 RepID=A0ABU9HU51_9FLAO